MVQRDDPLGIGVRPGDVIAGKYRVERVLGAGGMGAVVLAHHLVLDEKVALKFLLPDALGNAEAVARFVREAKAAVRIKSEHVARVSDVGYLENGAPYIVMEYLDGVDLAGWLQRSGALPVEQAVDFVLQACEAIAVAHALGIVHRDLKPANLFCIRRSDGLPSIKVLDFGISKITSPSGTSDMTRTNTVVGTPYYMSPEQMRASRDVDARSDVWSLGVILFELLTGSLPFVGENVMELAMSVGTTPAPALRTRRPDAPQGLERIVATCLEKERSARYQSVGDLAVALGEFAAPAARAGVDRILGTLRQAGIPRSGPDVGAMGARTAPDPSTASSWGKTNQTSNRRAAAWGVGVGATALLLAGGFFAWQALSPRPPVRAASPASAADNPVIVPASASAPAPASAPSPAPSQAPTPTPLPAQAGAGIPSRPPSPARPHAAAGAPAPVAPSPAPGTKPGCSPPYFFDADGHKQYKPECL